MVIFATESTKGAKGIGYAFSVPFVAKLIALMVDY
jgi:hypothetical protein